jgi:Carbohydrate family 9 binding domain-like
MKIIITIFIALILSLSCNQDQVYNKISDNTFPIPKIDFSPKSYVCYRTDTLLIIDGQLSEKTWEHAAWTDLFVDIEGESKPMPRFETRTKMLWDKDYFYFAAYIEEPHVWAKLTDRDAVIYYDNDFEVFIDPDGDTHEYYELEVNAFSTEWDLFLVKPYRDGGPALHSWDIQGLKTAVRVYGTLNDPSDTDQGWSIEIAIPWKVLRECAHKDSPPKDGDRWRVNFSRVEWQTEIKDGEYLKVIDQNTSKPLPENNWVWSPQGLINMHYPEMWGYVQFSNHVAGTETTEFQFKQEDTAKWALRQLYYVERTHQMQYGRYTSDISRLNLEDINIEGYIWPPEISATKSFLEVYLQGTGNNATLMISQDGRLNKKE